MDGTAVAHLLASTFGCNHAGYHRGAAFRLNRYLPALLTVGADATIGCEGYIVRRTQDDLAACIPFDLIGIDDACILKCCAVNTDRPTVRNYLAEVNSSVIARCDFDTHPWRAGIE